MAKKEYWKKDDFSKRDRITIDTFETICQKVCEIKDELETAEDKKHDYAKNVLDIMEDNPSCAGINADDGLIFVSWNPQYKPSAKQILEYLEKHEPKNSEFLKKLYRVIDKLTTTGNSIVKYQRKE